MINKRAVSPLIATVLLVMIVVSIGAAVMVIIQGLADEQIQATEAQGAIINCGTQVDLDIVEGSNGPRICIYTDDSNDEATIKLFMENTGIKDVQGWRLTMIGGDGVFDDSDQGTALQASAIAGREYNISGFSTYASSGITEMEIIRISPTISGGGTNPTVTCQEADLEFRQEDIRDWVNCSASDVTWDDSI